MAIQRKAPAAAPASRAAAPAARAAAKPNSHAAVQQYASLNPEDYTQGGLLDDVDVTFESCRFCEWDYDGNIDHPVLFLLVVMNYTDPATGKPAQANQYYSAGELSRFYPSEDGSHAVAVSGAKGLAGGTNAAILIKSVIDQGFPVDRFGDGDVSAMEGMVCHINRVAQPARGGKITGKTSSGYDATVAVVTKIHKMPWETAAPKGRPTTGGARPAATRPATPNRAAAPSPDANASLSNDVAEEAAGILIEVLNAKGGTIPKRNLPPACFKALAGNPNRSEILNLLADDDFLGTPDYGWEFDGQTISSVS